MDFQARTALVTGAAGSIGKAIAAAYCRAGLKVCISDLKQDAVDAAAGEIAAAGGVCSGRAADVTRGDQVADAVAAAADEFGGAVDILVNAAGVVAQGPVEDITEEEWDRVFAVNCRGTFLFTRQVVPLMKARRFGRIINFSSKSGKTGSALLSGYSATKAAIIGFTQALAYELAPDSILAYELAPDSITVNCICPGITEDTGVWEQIAGGYITHLKLAREEVAKRFTAKVPLGRLARVDDIAAVTLFLSSTGADYMTGQAINVTGGREMH
jgi:NAD(P)-dependent dehydrogenase (short-subunit alcohol dehydrogenase family)